MATEKENRKNIERLFKDLTIERVEAVNSNTLVDFKNKTLEWEVKNNVNCEEGCTTKGDYDTPEYKECVKSCEEAVERSLVGSVVIDKKGSVKESTIPVSCNLVVTSEFDIFEDEDETGKKQQTKEEELVQKLKKIGCKSGEVGWVHPHEFLPDPVEWEQDPAICYVHVQAENNSKCRLADVWKVLRSK